MLRRSRQRIGFSLADVLAVTAILGLLGALLLPALLRWRHDAHGSRCVNNMKQMGLAAHHYHNIHGLLPRYRRCPAPWKGGADPDCLAAEMKTPPPYTGEGELWWAPYDPRPGATPTQALADYVPKSILHPFLEGGQEIFRCPNGLDVRGTWGPAGQPFQVSYTWNITYPGGPAGQTLAAIAGGNGIAQVYLAWEHDGPPYCAVIRGDRRTGRTSSRRPVPRMPAEEPDRHYPDRHRGATMFLFCDGHVRATRRADLKDTFFFARSDSVN